MRRRPIVFSVVGASVFALAGFFGWIAWSAPDGPVYPWASGTVLLMGLYASVLTFQASSWIFGASPAFFAVSTVMLTSASELTGFESYWFGAAILVGAAHGLFAAKSCWTVLKEPRLRWWKSAPRTPLELRVRVCPVTGGEFSTWTSDLSERGAFLSLDTAKVSMPRHTGIPARTQIDPVSDLAVGTHCSIRLELNQYTAFTCSARVVRREDASKGCYRPGFGVVFVGLTGAQKRRLVRYLKTAADGRAPAALKTQTVAA